MVSKSAPFLVTFDLDFLILLPTLFQFLGQKLAQNLSQFFESENAPRPPSRPLPRPPSPIPRAVGDPSDNATRPNRLQPMFQCRGEGTDVTRDCTKYAHLHFAAASNRVTCTSTRSLHAFSELRTHAASCSHWAVNPTLLARGPQPRSRPMRDARF